MKRTEIVVIGAGIAGITASIYLKRANVDFVLLEGMNPGGKLNQLKVIENYPGYASISGSDLQLKLVEQLRSLNIKITYGNVQNILKENDGFEVKTDVDSYEAKAVIVASGLVTKSELIKGEKEYFGRGVSYCATCDGNFFKNLDVAVIGNNNIAIEEAIYLARLSKKVHIIVPDKKLEGSNESIKKLEEYKNVELHFGELVKEINGDDIGVTNIKTESNVYNVSGVFPYLGKKIAAEFLANLNPEMHSFALITDSKMMTNIPGLFAAGDIVDKNLRQLVNAASEGAVAATNAIIFVKQIHS